jgi:hypothetical protein
MLDVDLFFFLRWLFEDGRGTFLEESQVCGDDVLGGRAVTSFWNMI